MTPKRKKKRRQYTDDERANIVLMLEAAGYPNTIGALSRVARKVKCHPRTISRWFNKEQNPPPDQIVNNKKRDFITELKELLGLHIDASTKAVKDYDDLRAIDTGIGILVDKIQLLSGEPTDIKEVNVTSHRDGIMARVADESNGYVIGDAPRVHQKPIG